MKEVHLGRIVGLFASIPGTGLKSLIVSPIGQVQKPSRGMHLIHHFVHPCREGINAYIGDEPVGLLLCNIITVAKDLKNVANIDTVLGNNELPTGSRQRKKDIHGRV